MNLKNRFHWQFLLNKTILSLLWICYSDEKIFWPLSVLHAPNQPFASWQPQVSETAAHVTIFKTRNVVEWNGKTSFAKSMKCRLMAVSPCWSGRYLVKFGVYCIVYFCSISVQILEEYFQNTVSANCAFHMLMLNVWAIKWPTL